ncbi:MAG: hypothetical protein ACEQSX_19875 [Baekduiaceae bacterium]
MPPVLNRRLAVGLATVVAGLAATPAAQASCPPDDPCPSGTSLPTVDMGKVVLAASLDPSRVDLVKTAGAGRSVKLVEQALKARKLLPKAQVDGYFGSATTAAWAQLEVQLGQDKVWTRNALPGLQELQQLGKGRFRVVNAIDVGRLVTVPTPESNDGQDVLNTRTYRMYLAAQRNMKQANKKGWNMTIVQGGYCGSACADASAGTHSGGGSVDIRTIDTDAAGIRNRVAALKRVGFAAWYRDWSGNQHIHATAINDPQATWEMHGKGGAPAGAMAGYSGNCQIFEWKFKFDGLSGCNESRPSKDPAQQPIITWESYKASQR